MAWLPPYLGSWDGLVQALLHNPFLGSGQSPHPHLLSAMRTADSGAFPDPDGPEPGPPWRHVVASFVAAVNVRALASHVQDKATRTAMEQSAGQTIAQLLDDYCGTPPHKWPWPWPGTAPWVYVIAGELNSIAAGLPEGAMRSGLQQVAGQVITKGVGALQSGSAD
jgi:hypothetical protein